MNAAGWRRTAQTAAVVALALFAADRLAKQVFGRPPRRGACQTPPPGAVDVQIQALDGSTLRGWWLGPASTSGPVAVVMHGWGGCAADMIPVGDEFAALGLRVLLLDARGHGRSAEIAVASMPAFADDIRAALRWLPPSAPVLLVGHSVGAGACLYASVGSDNVAGVVSLAAIADPPSFMAAHLAPWLPGPLTRLALRYVEHAIGHRYTEFTPVNTIRKLQVPVLLLHGQQDTTVPVAEAHRLHELARGHSTLVVLPEADHASVEALELVRPELIAFLTGAGLVAHGMNTAGSAADFVPTPLTAQ